MEKGIEEKGILENGLMEKNIKETSIQESNIEESNKEESNKEESNKEESNKEESNKEVSNIEELGLIKYIKLVMDLPDTDIKSYSPLTLAFIGDGIYDLIIRTMIVERGNAPVNKLHKKVSNLVKAPAQMELFHRIEDKLTEDELSVYKRGRNAKSFSTAKNASMTEYRSATGLEALIGYLYLTNRLSRILELIKMGLEGQPA